jgi:ABC-type antimicrobial peptide transport system permease subunit
VLAVLGAIGGLIAAEWGGGVLRRLFLPADFGAPVITDPRTLVVALVVTVAVAVLTGLAPVIQALRFVPSGSLTSGPRDFGGRRSRMRTGLLLFQAALSVVLLVGAGLFVRSLHNVRALHLGFDVDPVVAVTLNMRGVALEPSRQVALERDLVDAAKGVPGVVSATPAPSVPFWGFEERNLFVSGVDSVGRLGNFVMLAGNTDFFRTFGTSILRGRAFGDLDVATSAPVVVVSDRMARALWPGQDPLGRCIQIDVRTAPCTTVIGVAEEMHIQNLVESASEQTYAYSVPISQFGDGAAGMLLVRAAGHATSYAPAIRDHCNR